MPGLLSQSQDPGGFFQVKGLHPTFGAEVHGVDLATISDEAFAELLTLMAKYGFLVLRDTGLDDTTHVEFSRRFGELDDIRPYMTGGRKPRYEYYELFDAGNVDADGKPLAVDSPRSHYGKGNGFFHVDSSFNPRRASYSLLRACRLPPPGTGGNTDFADSRTAFDTLPDELKQRLLDNHYAGCHSLHASRKRGSPEFFADLKPEDFPMHRHALVQVHESSDRMNLYIGAHLHHINGLSDTESWQLIWALTGWATRPENTVSVEWENEGDLIIWDNRAVLHRAAGGSYEGKYARDLRRTTVHDASSTAWGLNEQVDTRPGFNSNGKSQTARALGV
ncbi:hypothetical protein BAUCODRAFT_145130 [Baudoinia panamericana UAMH 10762]|uniref:TauD/TfdA-like domain-containing protein n=1 Tax=Baudoinia panamericana (strain UAMH 10762) TaxID=717646 RepID=M2NJZ2_BAUPA|nr:uncharacterized protein BAUCODRAFT_145130 [Baudoinia panamericana UAMH 10762]EMC99749.1 hypothetical protein BAUCODRAFT_145130 [Baudoinia panamericana UAMH 10762]